MLYMSGYQPVYARLEREKMCLLFKDVRIESMYGVDDKHGKPESSEET
jgi:hypothetical protein